MDKYYYYFQVTNEQPSHGKINNMLSVKQLVKAGIPTQEVCSMG